MKKRKNIKKKIMVTILVAVIASVLGILGVSLLNKDVNDVNYVANLSNKKINITQKITTEDEISRIKKFIWCVDGKILDDSYKKIVIEKGKQRNVQLLAVLDDVNKVEEEFLRDASQLVKIDSEDDSVITYENYSTVTGKEEGVAYLYFGIVDDHENVLFEGELAVHVVNEGEFLTLSEEDGEDEDVVGLVWYVDGHIVDNNVEITMKVGETRKIKLLAVLYDRGNYEIDNLRDWTEDGELYTGSEENGENIAKIDNR